MDAYIKSFSTYRTLQRVSVSDSSLIRDSLEDEQSSVTVAGSDIGLEHTGNWLIADGLVFRISSIKPQTDKTVLTLTSPLNAFSRLLELLQQTQADTVGGFIAAALQNNWCLGSDPAYAIGYLQVSNADATPFAAPETDSSGCFSLADYCRLMRKSYRTVVHFYDAGKNLGCSIYTAVPRSRKISFDDGRSLLQKVDYASSGIAKVTVLCDIETGEKDEDGNKILIRERSDWYLSESGEISQEIPVRRAQGEWGIIHVKGAEEISQKVTEAFAKKSANHKVEFWSSLDLSVQDSCSFFIYGKTLQSVISSKKTSDSDTRFYYKAGLLATTATEKIRRLSK